MTLLEFLSQSFTPFHAVQNARAILSRAGFVASESSLPNLRRGDKRFIDFGSALVAVSVGSGSAFHLVESHTDSPCLKIKNVQPGDPLRLNVECYGGGIKSSFLDRKLTVAGRIVTDEGGKLTASLYKSPFAVVAPSLAPHFGTSEGVTAVATQLYPLLGGNGKFLPENVVDYDLFAVPDEAPFYAGADNAFLCAPRLDNLLSVYASTSAIAAAKPHGIAVCVLFDSEEIGSGTVRGAASNLLPTVLKTIAARLGLDYDETAARSFALSVDNAHAAHPAHPDKADTAIRVSLNGGIVVKHHAHYATDGTSAAIVKTICRRADVPVQDYYHPSDLRCGSTLGLLAAAQTGIAACDIGCAQLAMHAALETIGSASPAHLQTALQTFYTTPLPVVLNAR